MKGTSESSIPNLGINNKNMLMPIIITANSVYNAQLGLVMNLPDSKVSVDNAMISCVFFRPSGVRTKVEPLNVVPIKTILFFIDDQSLSA
jgi:hypothetical protein